MKETHPWPLIITVATAITGYFGRNMLYPGTAPQRGFVFAAAAGLCVLLHRKDWL